MLPSIEDLFAIERQYFDKNRQLPPSVSDWHLNDVRPEIPLFQENSFGENGTYGLSDYLFSDSRKNEEAIILDHLQRRFDSHYLKLGVSIFTNTTAALFSIITHLSSRQPVRALVQSPFYFSIASALQYNRAESIYFHTKSKDHFNLNSNHFIEMAINQSVDVAILTDPVYCVGKCNSQDILHAVEVLSKLNVTCIIDASAGGLSTDLNHPTLEDVYLDAVLRLKNVFYVDSPTKKMLINSAKHALAFGDRAVLRNLEGLSDHFAGSLAREQLHVLSETFNEKNQKAIKKANYANAIRINRNYSLLAAICAKFGNLKVLKRSSGLYTLVSRTDICQKDVAHDEFYKWMMEREAIRAIPGHLFGLANTDGLSIRINLMRQPSLVAHAVKAFSEFHL